MKRKSLANELCPIARSLDVIGEWWSLLIIRDAMLGKRRFSDFQKSLGVAKNILAARLKKLVACGVLEQRPASDGSAFQEYALTAKGRELGTVLIALRLWGTRWPADVGAEPRKVVDKASGEEVRLEVRTVSGRSVKAAETTIVSLPGDPGDATHLG